MKSTSKLLIIGFSFLALATSAHAQTPREQLNQMVQQLQKTPNDNALREKIIKLAPTLKPSPALPDEAERRMVRGSTAFKSATSAAGYQDAAKEFEQATLAAPWYGDAYFNLGVAQDKAGNHEAALRSLKLAQLASPGSKEIKNLIYEVEYRNEKARAPEAEAARQAAIEKAKDETLLNSLNDAVFVSRFTDDHGDVVDAELHFKGRVVTSSHRAIALTEVSKRAGGQVGFVRVLKTSTYTLTARLIALDGGLYSGTRFHIAPDGLTMRNEASGFVFQRR